MNSLQFLGTGPGVPVPGRFNTCVLLRPEGGGAFLLDAGEPCAQRLRETGFDLAGLDAVMLSHAHSDHVGGFPMLVQALWLSGRTSPLPVHLPGELIKPLRAWLDAVLLPATLLGFELRLIPWDPQRLYEWPGLRVRVFETTHLHSLRQRIDPASTDRFHVFAPVLELAGRRVVVSSDLGGMDDLAGELREPLDVLVCELSHFSLEELAGTLREIPVGQLCLTHLSPEWSGRAEELQRRLSSLLPRTGNVRVVADGEVVEF